MLAPPLVRLTWTLAVDSTRCRTGSALVQVPWIVYTALVMGGAAWMAVMSTFNTATMSSVPPWVRSRAAALHTLCALGSFAVGSAFWGLAVGFLALAARRWIPSRG